MNIKPVEGRFEGKVAIVTGGYQGIGLGIVKRFLAEGGKVAYCGRSQEKIDAVKDELGENAFGMVCDVRCADQIKAFVDAAIEKFGTVDVLFNNAGVIERTAFYGMPIEELDNCYETNVKGTAMMAQALANYWIPKEIKGIIVNTGSINSVVASPSIPAYCASKGAVLLLTKAMAIDLGAYGIRVNCYGPATTRTPMTVKTTTNESRKDFFMSKLLVKRFAEPDDMAATACFLASDDAQYLAGAYIPVDAGTTSITGCLTPNIVITK